MMQATTAQSEELGLRVFIGVLIARRWWIVASVLVCTAAFTSFAFLSTPIYRSAVVLMPAASDRNNLNGSLNSMLGQAGGLVSLLGVGPGATDSATEEALAVLRSRDFTERFIAGGGLMPDLFPDRWDSEVKRWKSSAKIPTPAKGFKYFDTYVRSIEQDKKTGLVILQIEWKDRVEASNWANELIGQLNSEMRARAITKADASVAFLEKELTSTTVLETRDAINRLIEAQEKQRMIANVTYEFAFEVVDKALPPDQDDPVRPKKALLAGLGFFLGIGLSISGIALHRAMSMGI
jgi:Chain length determinant protein